MNIDLPPLLYLTVSVGSHTKTVNAFLDSGSPHSYISLQLANELKMISKDEKNVETTSSKLFKIQVSDPGRIYEPISISVLCRSLPDVRTYSMPSGLINRLSHILQIPFQVSSDDSKVDLFIGSFHMSELFMPDSFPPKCYSIAPNLNAIETHFGYYLQGKQTNNNFAFINNWSLYNFSSLKTYNCFAFYIILDLLLIYFYFVL